MSRFSTLTLLSLSVAFSSTTAKSVTGEPNSKLAKNVSPTASARRRSLTFPGDKSFGTLCIVRPDRRGLHGIRRVAAARGTVVVEIPAEAVLMYEPSQKVLLEPAQINSFPTVGIDVVHFGFMSMDTSEDGICDRAVKLAPHFTSCSYLNIANSDCSDSGVDQIKSMPSLKGLWASSSGVRGHCLKSLDRFPNLEEVDISRCTPFDLSRLVNLTKLPHLKSLYLDSTGITNDSIRVLTNCKSLETLDIRGNKMIDDSCLPDLASMKKLSDLSLNGTAISTKGLEQLTKLHLEHILLPNMSYTEGELRHIRKILPGTRLAVKDTAHEREEAKMIKESTLLAPLKH